MKRIQSIWALVALALALGPVCAWLEAGAAAQLGTSTLSGEVKDMEGKPYPDVIIIITNEQGRKWQTKTDKNGRYTQGQLPGGIYTIDFQVKDRGVVWQTKLRLESNSKETADANLKELAAQQGLAKQEEMKREEAQKQQFESLKTHFDAGSAAMEQAKTARAELAKTPPEQRAAVQEKVSGYNGTAVTEFEAALKAAGDTDPNRPVVLGRLGEAYLAAGRYQDAADVYQKAIDLKPDQATFFNNLGNALARLGKMQEAMAAYERSAALDPANAAVAYRNAGIELYNANRMKEAIEPLKKSIDVDPKNAQAWYLLGVALVNTMEFKKEGDKLVAVVQPGTVEAYQKAIELDPNGAYGAQARQGLEALEQIAPGIQTKVRTRPTKK